MKTFIKHIFIVGLVLVIATMVGCSPATEVAVQKSVSVDEAHNLVEDGAFLLDVRELSEWNTAHIDGATLIPLGELANRVNEVPKDQLVVVICRSGNRSQAGRDTLLNAGFENVTSVDGGLNNWIASGYPSVSGP